MSEQQQPFQPSHNWDPSSNTPAPAVPGVNPAAAMPGKPAVEPHPAQPPVPEAPMAPGSVVSAEAEVKTTEPVRAGAEASPRFQVGESVKVKGRGKGSFEVEGFEDGLYHFTSNKGAKFTATEADLDAHS